MKLQGRTFDKPNQEVCVLPRPDGDIVFTAEAILDYTEFDALCPEIVVPAVVKPGGKKEFNIKDAGYLAQVAARAEKRVSWMMLKSLQATEGLVWETVNMDDSSTWGNYKDELRAAKFSHVEIQRLESAVFSANCLNEARVQEARDNFLLGQAAE